MGSRREWTRMATMLLLVRAMKGNKEKKQRMTATKYYVIQAQGRVRTSDAKAAPKGLSSELGISSLAIKHAKWTDSCSAGTIRGPFTCPDRQPGCSLCNIVCTTMYQY
jgi:hypothetical protein